MPSHRGRTTPPRNKECSLINGRHACTDLVDLLRVVRSGGEERRHVEHQLRGGGGREGHLELLLDRQAARVTRVMGKVHLSGIDHAQATGQCLVVLVTCGVGGIRTVDPIWDMKVRKADEQVLLARMSLWWSWPGPT